MTSQSTDSRTVIVDEAHKMKRPDSRLAIAAKSISDRACFALTGTLVQNRIEELWSVLDFARRGWAGTPQQWKNYAVNPINSGHKFDGSLKDVVSAVVSGTVVSCLWTETRRRTQSKDSSPLLPSQRQTPHRPRDARQKRHASALSTWFPPSRAVSEIG